MTRKALSLGIMGALVAISMAMTPTMASAHDHDNGRHRGWYDHGPRDRGYDDRRYRGGDRGYYGGRGYERDRHRCRDGTGGAIIGAIAGGLLGNAVAGYGDRTAGTIIGGGVGALAGNAIGRDC